MRTICDFVKETNKLIVYYSPIKQQREEQKKYTYELAKDLKYIMGDIMKKYMYKMCPPLKYMES